MDERLLFKFYETWERKESERRWFRFKVRYLGEPEYLHYSRSVSSLSEAKLAAERWFIAHIRAEPCFPREARLDITNTAFDPSAFRHSSVFR